MDAFVLKLTTLATLTSLFLSTPFAAQLAPSTPKAARVRITHGPELEMTRQDEAIVRWTSDNPGGSPEHYAMVHFGINPHDLNQTAKSPIRLNPDNRYTVFRVRIDGLRPQTTYYYTVQSMDSNGTTDGVKSTLSSFRTP